jgi:hypothetical protein
MALPCCYQTLVPFTFPLVQSQRQGPASSSLCYMEPSYSQGWYCPQVLLPTCSHPFLGFQDPGHLYPLSDEKISKNLLHDWGLSLVTGLVSSEDFRMQ